MLTIDSPLDIPAYISWYVFYICSKQCALWLLDYIMTHLSQSEIYENPSVE